MVRVGIAALEKLCEGFSRTHCETVVRSRPVLSTAKAEALATFNRLRSRGSRVLTHGGGHAYVLREYDIDECVDELGRRLLRWKHAAIGNQLKLAKKTVATKLDELRCLEQGLLDGESRGCSHCRHAHTCLSFVLALFFFLPCVSVPYVFCPLITSAPISFFLHFVVSRNMQEYLHTLDNDHEASGKHYHFATAQ